MKRLLTLVLVLMLVIQTVSFATTDETNANILKEIGVFQGTDSGFELERAPTRLEGLIMFIRLLGEEDEALASKASHPFTDVPSWANGYVGYAYERGYTKGVSADKFGTDSMQAKSYMTFVLRSLNYDDMAGDFSWNNAIDFAKDKAVISYATYTDLTMKEFLRGHIADSSLDALKATYKDSSETMIEKLVGSGAILSEVAKRTGLLEEAVEVVELVEEAEKDVSNDGKASLYSKSIFTVTEANGVLLAEMKKGSFTYDFDVKDGAYSYVDSLNYNKIIRHEDSLLLADSEFASNLPSGVALNYSSDADKLAGDVRVSSLEAWTETVWTSERFYKNEAMSYYGELTNYWKDLQGTDYKYMSSMNLSYRSEDSFDIDIFGYLDAKTKGVIEATCLYVIGDEDNATAVYNEIEKKLNLITVSTGTELPVYEGIPISYDLKMSHFEFYVNGYYVRMVGENAINIMIK